MKKYLVLVLSCLPAIYFSCTSKIKKAQVMAMDGSIWEVRNFNDVEFSKGDSIVLVHYCNHKDNPCQTSIYGFYKGTLLPTDVIWEAGKIKASYSYQKAVFLKDINDR